MFNKIEQSFLFCASDIGGAKNLAPLVKEIESRGFGYYLIASRQSSSVFSQEYCLDVDKAEIRDLDDARKYLRLKKPDKVICGTTRYLSPDRLFITAARELNIKSIVVLDEWFNYRARFQDGENKLTYLPDIIFCQDKRAAKEAADEGLPWQSLLITGSPYLSILAKKTREFPRSSSSLPDFLKGKTRPVITFLSETHSLDYGTKPGEEGSLGKFIGYTEHSVREDIFDTLNKIGGTCTIVEKLHPGDNAEYYPLSNEFIEWITVRETKLWPLLWHSDFVIGMRSIALLESAILGCSAVSYQPNLMGEQLCTAVRLNLIEGIYSKDEFCSWLEKNSSRRISNRNASNRYFSFAGGDVIQNTADSILI